jgi:methionyl-tRNA formyltransferase
MKILFWGTPAFAVPSLLALSDEGHDIVGVVTQPDRPAGRGRRLRSSAVKETALEESIPVLEPESPRGEDFLEQITALGADLSVVVAYGQILQRAVLVVPPMGSINLHASLLPALRGAAPINWAIVRGDEVTGVTVMRMAERMDSGPILLQTEEPILEGETVAELTTRLSEIGAEALVEALALLAAGAIEERGQEESAATYAPKVDRATARIDWAASCVEVAGLIRGMDAVPGAWSELDGNPVKLFRPQPATDNELAGLPGTILEVSRDGGLMVSTGQGAVWITEVQPAGKSRMRAGDWVLGRAVTVGQRFE